MARDYEGEPPANRMAHLVCSKEQLATLHEFVGKEARYAGRYEVELRIRYRCQKCGAVRLWGSEMLAKHPEGAQP